MIAKIEDKRKKERLPTIKRLIIYCISNGWISIYRYDAKRVIVREGHLPICFYFVLTGSGKVNIIK